MGYGKVEFGTLLDEKDHNIVLGRLALDYDTREFWEHPATGDRALPVNWKNIAHYLAVGAIQYDDPKMEKRLLGFLKRVEEEETRKQRELVEERIANDGGTPFGTLLNMDDHSMSLGTIALNYDTEEFRLYPTAVDKPATVIPWQGIAYALANENIKYYDPKMRKRLLGYLFRLEQRDSPKTTPSDDAGNGDDNGSDDSDDNQTPEDRH